MLRLEHGRLSSQEVVGGIDDEGNAVGLLDTPACMTGPQDSHCYSLHRPTPCILGPSGRACPYLRCRGCKLGAIIRGSAEKR